MFFSVWLTRSLEGEFSRCLEKVACFWVAHELASKWSIIAFGVVDPIKVRYLDG